MARRRGATRPLHRSGLNMEVILHLGAHRTGTSSLQAWMMQNEGALERAGIAVWGPERTRAGLFAGLVKRPDLIGPADVLAAHRSAMRIRMEIDALADRGIGRLVISEENLLGAMPVCHAHDMIYPDARGRLLRVAEALGPHLSGVALSVRRYDMWWASVLSVMLRRGAARPEPARLARLAEDPQGWRRVIAIAQETLGVPVTVWPFEALVGRHDAQLRALAPGAALPAGLYEAGRVQNAGPSGALLARMRHAAGTAAEGDIFDLGEDGHFMPFAPAQRGAMTARYLEDLDWLRRAPPGLSYVERDAEIAGTHPRAVTEEEGAFHDDQERGLGQARAEGAA